MKNRSGKVIIKFVFYVFLFGTVATLLYLSNSKSAIMASKLVASLGALVSIIYSKIYLFLTPRKKCGEIINLDVRVVNQRNHPGAIGGEHYSTHIFSEVVIDIETKDKKIISKVFPYKGSNRMLHIGDQIAFVRFSDYPVKI